MTTQTQHSQDGAGPMPSWLRERYAGVIEQQRRSVEQEAARTGKAAGVVADQRVRSILADARPSRRGKPSPATLAAYERDYAHLLDEQRTPLEKATTFQHHNRLRSGFRFCEQARIEQLRQQSERARREQDGEAMRLLTWDAFERAVVFDALFLAHDRPTWGQKAAALRAAGGGKKAGKSKRAAGRRAPSPDQLLVSLASQPGRASRVEIPALCFALFGVRPAELCKGARLEISGEGLSLVVEGAKVDELRGQKSRTLTIAATATASGTGFGQSLMAVSALRDAVARGRGWVQLTNADLVAVRRAMKEVQPGLSPYAYRHARASDAKASKDRGTVAAWMGHRTDRAQSYYGNGRSGSGAVRVEAAVAASPIRAVKGLPLTLAQRLAKVEANKHAKLATRAGTVPPAPRSPKRRGPRLK